MSYVSTHAGALRDIRKAGTAVTFSKETRVHDPLTGHSTVSTTTVEGFAIRVVGRSKTYEALKLVESQAPTLLFAATTFGEIPDVGMTVPWGGETFTVADVNPVAPDGNSIIARVVIAK